MHKSLQKIGIEVISEAIAEGGTSVIHKACVVAQDSAYGAPGTLLAIKEYKSAITSAPDQRQRIAQEATLTSQVTDPNVVKSWGLVSAENSGTELHVLEWIEGPTLQRWIQDASDSHDWSILRPVALGILGGIAALHERGIVHRDLKSENILMVGDTPKLVDLGIAEAHLDESATMHTQMKDFIGSIRFASPQFVRGEHFAPEDDIYGCGTVFFELFTGVQVYEDVERKTLLSAEILRRPPNMRALRPSVPSPMKVLLEGMLHPSRPRRPTLAECRDAILNPENAPYLQRELDAQSRDRRGYEVIAVDNEGKSAFVDLRNDPDFDGLDEVWRIVRRDGKRVNVPSAGGEIALERWIADVHTKHVHAGVAHCIRVVRRWHSDQNAPRFAWQMFSSSGQWRYDEPAPDKIKVGDLLVKV